MVLFKKIIATFFLVFLVPIGIMFSTLFFQTFDFTNLAIAVAYFVLAYVLYYWGFKHSKKVEQRKNEAKAFPKKLAEWYQTLSANNIKTFSGFNPAEYRYRPIGNERLLDVEDNVFHRIIENTGSYSFEQKGSSRDRYLPWTDSQKHMQEFMGDPRIETLSGSVKPDQKEIINHGRFVVTSDALVFEGDKKNYRFLWPDISSIETQYQTTKVALHSGEPMVFESTNFSAAFAALLLIMLE